jgi:peptidyl-prolyl cis-trans isomerase D
MEAIAKSAGSTVLQATDVIMENPMLTGVGLEPKVVGTAFALGVIKCLHLNTGYMLLLKT